MVTPSTPPSKLFLFKSHVIVCTFKRLQSQMTCENKVMHGFVSRLQTPLPNLWISRLGNAFNYSIHRRQHEHRITYVIFWSLRSNTPSSRKMEEEDHPYGTVAAKISRGSPTYCVTGATGYIGSWLVKVLLERGYRVHATVRDPEKSLHLLPLWRGGDRLRLFEADLQNEGSFDEAVNGCEGAFHVAASMEFSVHENDNNGNADKTYVQSNIIDPAIRGTLNLLRSCLKSKTVKRVVFTSSISSLTAKDSNGNWRQVVDETCQTPIDHIWKKKASGWVYALSKLLTEEAAFKFAHENDLDLVSVISTTIAGGFLISSAPSSIQVLLSPITGDSKFFSILSAVNARMGSIALAHIEDLCNAHLFLMEERRAEGKYICCTNSCPLSELVELLLQQYPNSNVQRYAVEKTDSVPSEISSKKLRDLGFDFKHGIQDIVRETVASCVECGYLTSVEKSNS